MAVLNVATLDQSFDDDSDRHRACGLGEMAVRYPVPSGGPNEVWSFGEKAYAIIQELLLMRERLKPYIQAQTKLAHEKGIPPMRPLFFDFEDDGCFDVDDQFMFGPGLLVAPVLHEGLRRRQVYLPLGARWTDAWTGQTVDGGQWIAADAPLARIPLYTRDGARLPIQAT